ncbi:dienelactone hydrolase family protein [Agromyces sp. SYSU T00266]|uniref:dienelactone hydrolase family protein n=1 Tax=Agromyces zhanjiangensis TaxID=3158562 RepID=UPI0033922D77
MNEILLFHHGQGLTDGVLAFAETLRSAGHLVHTPDYYDGKVFATLDEGVAYRDEIGIPELANRAVAAAQSLPTDLVYAGFSLGTGPAQLLAQTRPGARGALLMSGCLPAAAFETPWPTGVPLAVHTTEQDPWVDLDVARGLVAEAHGDLELYPGSAHLFADPTNADHDAELGARLEASVIEWLEVVDRTRQAAPVQQAG